MKVRKVIALKEVAVDLEEGRLFYDEKEQGVGDYFGSSEEFMGNFRYRKSAKCMI